MLVTLVATLCIAGADCTDKVVTTEATLMQCGGGLAQAGIAKWMDENGFTARGYVLSRWRCEIGKRPERA